MMKYVGQFFHLVSFGGTELRQEAGLCSLETTMLDALLGAGELQSSKGIPQSCYFQIHVVFMV